MVNAGQGGQQRRHVSGVALGKIGMDGHAGELALPLQQRPRWFNFSPADFAFFLAGLEEKQNVFRTDSQHIKTLVPV